MGAEGVVNGIGARAAVRVIYVRCVLRCTLSSLYIIYVPQTAVRMGFLLAARELGRGPRGRSRTRPGARFVPNAKTL